MVGGQRIIKAFPLDRLTRRGCLELVLIVIFG